MHEIVFADLKMISCDSVSHSAVVCLECGEREGGLFQVNIHIPCMRLYPHSKGGGG